MGPHQSSLGSPRRVTENPVLRAQHAPHTEPLSTMHYFPERDLENWKLMYRAHKNEKRIQGADTWWSLTDSRRHTKSVSMTEWDQRVLVWAKYFGPHVVTNGLLYQYSRVTLHPHWFIVSFIKYTSQRWSTCGSWSTRWLHLEQTWTNYSPWVRYSPLGFLIQPTTHVF